MTDRELLSCPFCGGEAEWRYIEAYGMHIVHCLSCGARTGLYKTSWKAEEKWNTRTNTAEKAVIIKEFVSKLKEHKCSYDLDNYHSFEAIDVDDIDDAVKEFLGEDYDR